MTKFNSFKFNGNGLVQKVLLVICVLIVFTAVISAQNVKNPKRGIGFGYHSEADMEMISGSLSWWYNWYHQPESKVADVYQNYDMEFVPMTWNGSFNETALRAYLDKHPDAKYLLGFNEPNFKEQANMTPTYVASLWPKLEAIAADYNLEIVGPAVNWCGECVSENGVTYTDPYKYLDDFFAACPDCRVDYIAVHTYMCYASALRSFIDGFRKYNRKIWLTEFACWDQPNITLDMQKSYMVGALDFLDNDTAIYKYAWFPGDRKGNYPYISLYMPESGVLSELGQLYVNYSAVHDTNIFYQVPGRIEAENYSAMYGTDLEGTKDFDGNANVGWIDAHDWLQYNIEVPEPGIKRVYLRVSGNGACVIQLKEGDNVLADLNIPSSGGWQSWKTHSTPVDLAPGKHRIILYTPSGGFNLNWIHFSDKEAENTAPVITIGDNQTVNVSDAMFEITGLATDADGDALKYKWAKTSGSTKFKIENAWAATTSVSNITEGSYVFTLSASDGFNVVTEKTKIVVEKATSVGLLNTEGQIVYPNPVSDKLYVNTALIGNNAEILISDQLGKILYKKKLSAEKAVSEIDFSNFKKGFYLVKVSNTEKTHTSFIIR